MVTKWVKEYGKRRHEDMREAERIDELKDRRQKEEAEKKREAARKRREASQEELRVQEAKRQDEEVVPSALNIQHSAMAKANTTDREIK